MQKVETKFTS